MHAIKGGWVGRPLALAKSNDSERRKTRIRRSKEERKTMVESFIKKYQKLNNGSFPSLNLTHKEVGGSFYTVREIVRDIIQENRVLGPAKFSLEEQSSNQLLEQDALGSIAIGPQYPFTTLSNDHQFVTSYSEGVDEPLFESDADYVRPEHQIVTNGKIINGTELDVKLEESSESNHTTLEESEPVEAEENVDVGSDANSKIISDTELDVKLEESSESNHTTLEGNEPVEAEENVDVGSDANSKIISATELDVKLEESSESNHTTLEGSEPLEAEQNVDVGSDVEAVLVSDEQCSGSLHQIVNEPSISGNQVDVEKRESDENSEKDLELSEADLLMNVPSKEDKIREELAAFSIKVTPAATDVMVETFPLRPITSSNDILGRGTGEVKDTTDTLKNQEAKKVDLTVDAQSSLNDRINYLEHSGLVDEKEIAINSSLVLEENPPKDEEATKNHGNLLLESSNFSAPKEGADQDIQSYTDSTTEVSHNDARTSEAFEQSLADVGAKADKAQIGIGTIDKNGRVSGQSKTEIKPVIENQVDAHSGSTQNGSNPTLDRINLESWGGAAKSSAKPGGNPILAFFRSFVTSFVKFWTE